MITISYCHSFKCNISVMSVYIHDIGIRINKVFYNNNKKQFDKVINVAGPWVSELLEVSGIDSDYELDLVRGSHIVVNRKFDCGYFIISYD